MGTIRPSVLVNLYQGFLNVIILYCFFVSYPARPESRAKQQQLKADFEAYLDSFSPNVQEILGKFKFRNQIPTLMEADILSQLKFLIRNE
jgi:hypothetical protein